MSSVFQKKNMGYINVTCIHNEGGKTPDAMSQRYSDTSLPNLLGRPSLYYADQAPAMQ